MFIYTVLTTLAVRVPELLCFRNPISYNKWLISCSYSDQVCVPHYIPKDLSCLKSLTKKLIEGSTYRQLSPTCCLQSKDSLTGKSRINFLYLMNKDEALTSPACPCIPKMT